MSRPTPRRNHEGSIHFTNGSGRLAFSSHIRKLSHRYAHRVGTLAGLETGVKKRNTEIIGLSVDTSAVTASGGRHRGDAGNKVNYPMIGDPQLGLETVQHAAPARQDVGSRTPADNLTVAPYSSSGRTEDQTMLVYPMSTGAEFRGRFSDSGFAAADGESWVIDSGELATWGKTSWCRRNVRRGREEEISRGLRTLKPYLRMGSSRV